MKILLTGAGGFLGKAIATSLLAEGAQDLRLHYRRKPDDALIAPLRAAHPEAHIETCGANLLADKEVREIVQDVDCIVHAAAGMRGAVADMFANTVIGTRNLLEAAREAGVTRIVLISSFSVYRTEHLADKALLSEATELEPEPTRRGAYAYAKTRQEQLFREFTAQAGIESVILRPGVIYGPGGSAISPRVGLQAMGLFFSLGNGVTLPLTYVENCADAVARATLHGPAGAVYNVVDDDLPSCRDYEKGYRSKVQKLRALPIPYRAFVTGSAWLERYHKRSKGQLPAVFTPYVVRSMYRPLSYSNAALKAIGWRQRVPTAEGMARNFDWLAGQRARQ